MSLRRGERILGPYPDRNGFRVIQVDAAGNRESEVFETEAKAERYIELLKASLVREEHTTETALAEYKKCLKEKGNKEESTDVTAWAIEQFFPSAVPLQLLSAKRCDALYADLRSRPTKRTNKPLAADTHRNILAQTKSFLEWCVDRGSRMAPDESVRRHQGDRQASSSWQVAG